jgi:PAS domain S-box-containing protein
MNSLAPTDISSGSSQSLLGEPLLESPDDLLNLLPIGVYVCNKRGAIVRHNSAVAELWGRFPTERDRYCGSFRLYRLDGVRIVHDDFPVAHVLAAGISVRNHEVVMERPDGSRIVVALEIVSLRDPDGAVVGAVSCLREATPPRQPQCAMREIQPHSDALLQELPVAIYSTDADGRITFYNVAAAALWGCRPHLGKSEFFGSWKLFWPDGTPLPYDESPMALALKEKQPDRGAEAVAVRPDGSRVPFIAFSTPLRDASGILTGAINMLVNITDRQQSEQAVQRLAAIVESSEDAILAKDLSGIITSWNQGAERLFGYTADEIIGKSGTMLIPMDRHDEEPAILARVRRGERVEHYETIRRRKDGNLVELSLTVSPVRNSRGDVVGASKIARDITERRRAQERQHLLLREMDHRIKNLFALSSSVVSLSARSANTPEELASAVRERLGALAQAHALTLQKASHDTPRFAPSTTLHTLIRTLVAPYIDETDQDTMRVVIRGSDLVIPHQFVTSFALLLHEFTTNAVKYGALSSAKGHIEIDCCEDGNRFTLAWSECGGPLVPRRGDGDGFGSLLTRTTVRRQLGGEISREWNPQGLKILLSVDRNRLLA